MQYNSENAIKPEQFSDNPDSEFYEQKFKTILFETYIVLEQDDSVLLIDQHAAHGNTHRRRTFEKQVGRNKLLRICYYGIKRTHVFFIISPSHLRRFKKRAFCSLDIGRIKQVKV